MRKRLGCLVLSLLIAVGAVGCAPFSSAQKQTVTYLDVFDTATTVTVYGVDKAQFDADMQRFHMLLTEYHRLYDIYHTYPDLVNLKSINDAAGGQALAVDSRVMDLLSFGQEVYTMTDGRVNILFGSVLSLWHNSRTAGVENPASATLPDAAALTAAAAHTDPSDLEIDRVAGTVRITDSQARLDVGAIAKGYVAEQAARYAITTLGWTSAMINLGGNIRVIGGKGDEHTPFTVGIQNPDSGSAQAYSKTVSVRDAAVVTSGDYQRFYTVDGVRYAHIIDPDTLYPATHVRAVTVLCADSGLADALSTALFTLPMAEGEKLLERVNAAEAMWVLADGTIHTTDGFEDSR